MAVDTPVIEFNGLTMGQIQCVIAASLRYEIPANAFLAIAQQEGGKPGQWVGNANGTFDIGAMQLNTAYLKQLEKYGIRPEHAASPTCYPYTLAGWRLKGHLVNDQGGLWTRLANYHSRTSYYNQKYASELVIKAAQWANWLQAHYETRVLDTKNATTLPPARTADPHAVTATAVSNRE